MRLPPQEAEDDDGDVGEKVGSPSRKYIGLLLPSPMKGSSSTGSPTKKVKTHHDIAGKMDPQAEKVKQRIQATKDPNQAKAEKVLAVLESYDSSDAEGAEGEKDDDDDDVHSNSKKAEKGKEKAKVIAESDEDEDDDDQGEKDASTSSSARQPSPPSSSKHTHSSPIASNNFYSPPRPSTSKSKSPRLNSTTAPNKKHSNDSSDDDNSTNSSPVKRPTIYQRHFHGPDKPKKHKPFFERSKMRTSMDSNNGQRGGYVNPFRRIGSENS